MTEQKHQNTELLELGCSNFEIEEGQPDIRGWMVKNYEGHRIGKVEELLFNPTSCSVRYIIIEVDKDSYNIDEDKKILVPIGAADLYDDRLQYKNESNSSSPATNNRSYNPLSDGKVVIVPISMRHIMQLPEYLTDSINPETEMLIRNIYLGNKDITSIQASAPYDPNEFYNHYHFDQDRFYDGKQLSSVESLTSRSEQPKSRIRQRCDEA
ncbi:PRC-barrel domain-containing protein [Sphingobacterium paucimobilis]|uniref:PRC-barrel domain-containing protein n=1 Tax=Sphingobacterium paucimobilis HER1398 TaxID=1346330 RepID=U2HVI6_9SPHI|nr:PRC-barrel domain-containing protein [Sphingobacterium paucimobilis]ERJ59285.1 hypothetical protein M472_10915 [Sphingobacterium paucimobilis HER1398]